MENKITRARNESINRFKRQLDLRIQCMITEKELSIDELTNFESIQVEQLKNERDACINKVNFNFSNNVKKLKNRFLPQQASPPVLCLKMFGMELLVFGAPSSLTRAPAVWFG